MLEALLLVTFIPGIGREGGRERERERESLGLPLLSLLYRTFFSTHWRLESGREKKLSGLPPNAKSSSSSRYGSVPSLSPSPLEKQQKMTTQRSVCTRSSSSNSICYRLLFSNSSSSAYPSHLLPTLCLYGVCKTCQFGTFSGLPPPPFFCVCVSKSLISSQAPLDSSSFFFLLLPN